MDPHDWFRAYSQMERGRDFLAERQEQMIRRLVDRRIDRSGPNWRQPTELIVSPMQAGYLERWFELERPQTKQAGA